MKEVSFQFGALSESLEIQSRSQGFVLKNSDKWEKCKEAIIRIRFNLNLPDGEYGKLINRFLKNMIKDLEPIYTNA